VVKYHGNQSGGRVSKGRVYNAEGRTLVEFCESNVLEMLIGKYVEHTKGDYTFIYQLGESVTDCALMSETMLRDLVDFRIETEITSSHMS
jgi:hypothetical protein